MGAGVEALPDFPLRTTEGPGRPFVELGIKSFRAAARYVQALPYGRNSDRSDPRLVMEEGRGTCSTKHALLAALAAENAPTNLSPVELRLGVYEMHEGNTPGVGAVLRRHGLACVPEAHCYLAYEGVRVDLTRREGGEAEVRFLEEERIDPRGIGGYKVEWHKRLLQEWAEARGLDAAAVWRAREECIEALAGGTEARRRRQPRSATPWGRRGGKRSGRSSGLSGREMVAAAIQMSSTPDKGENKETAEALIRAAVAAGAELVALPELWSCHGLEEAYRENAEPIPGPTTEFMANLARELGAYLLGGSILEGEAGAERLSNTSTFFGPDGEMSAVYRKIHLFDVKAPDREYLESGTIAPGDEVVTAKAGPATLGLSVCYDVRFPELYRLLALRGAEVLAVPAAFTLQTGKDHWEVLLRARAIENQAFVVAPAQWGQKADGRQTYGRSIIVDPWGTVLATCSDRDGFALVPLDLAYLDRFRTDFPSLANRRPEAYGE